MIVFVINFFYLIKQKKNKGNFDFNNILDLTESNSRLDSSNTSPNSFSINKNMPTNIHILQIQHFNESRNYTCQAHNSFGLVLFNLSLVIKGFFFIWIVLF